MEIAFSPDGKRLSSAGHDGDILIHDVMRDPRGLYFNSATIGTGAILGLPVPLGDPATLGSIAISAIVTRDDNAIANAVTAAFAGGAGADYQIKVTLAITARLDDSGRVTAYGSTEITAAASIRANAEAFGLSLGGITVGLSFARAEDSPIMTAEIGQRAILRVDGDVTLQTLENPGNDLSSEQTGTRGTFDKAVPGSGAIGAGSGATATVVHRPELRSAVRESNSIDAGDDLVISTRSRTKALATALGGTVGVVGVGSVNASVDDLPLVFVNLHTGTGLRASDEFRFDSTCDGLARQSGRHSRRAGVGLTTTQVAALEGFGGNDNFVVTNQGGPLIGGSSVMNGVLSFGSVAITAFGYMRIEEPIQGTTISLTTSDQSTTGQDMILLALVRATVGAITLNAADGFNALPFRARSP